MIFSPGQTIGIYRIIRQLGKGGMGAVYEVEHTQLGVHYALKAFTLNDQDAVTFSERFAVEGRLLARLHHPNLVHVFDLNQDAETGVLYYVMDCVLYKDGEAHTLADLENDGASESQICQWFVQLCDAIAYIHEQGIVHRDIKLNNILLAPDKSVVLSDFGVSRITTEELRQDLGSTAADVTSTFIVGTQRYMAPEMLCGDAATPATDVYALGVVFFKLLTGEWFKSCSQHDDTIEENDTHDIFSLLDRFELRWKDVLSSMLAFDPANRFTDLRALPSLLCQPEKVQKRPTRIKLPLLIALSALVLLIVIIVTGVITWNVLHSDEPSSDVATPAINIDLVDDAFDVPDSLR